MNSFIQKAVDGLALGLGFKIGWDIIGAILAALSKAVG